MFYYSIESKEKVVHYGGCHHLKNIKKENLRSFKNVKEMRSGEYRICSCCSPITEHLKKEQTELENFCQENGLSYFVNKGNLHIRTHYSKWKVLVSDNKKREGSPKILTSRHFRDIIKSVFFAREYAKKYQYL